MMIDRYHDAGSRRLVQHEKVFLAPRVSQESWWQVNSLSANDVATTGILGRARTWSIPMLWAGFRAARHINKTTSLQQLTLW